MQACKALAGLVASVNCTLAPCLYTLQKPLRCNVVHISFSAHADYEQTSGFLGELAPVSVLVWVS
jgi:hypothetical protein